MHLPFPIALPLVGTLRAAPVAPRIVDVHCVAEHLYRVGGQFPDRRGMLQQITYRNPQHCDAPYESYVTAKFFLIQLCAIGIESEITFEQNLAGRIETPRHSKRAKLLSSLQAETRQESRPRRLN